MPSDWRSGGRFPGGFGQRRGRLRYGCDTLTDIHQAMGKLAVPCGTQATTLSLCGDRGAVFTLCGEKREQPCDEVVIFRFCGFLHGSTHALLRGEVQSNWTVRAG